MTNSFHQFPLTEMSSQRLAIQSPWGLVKPVFLPEGVSPASGHLQWTMMQMFGDFDEWSIVIFDNVLLLAHDQDDACKKLRSFVLGALQEAQRLPQDVEVVVWFSVG